MKFLNKYTVAIAAMSLSLSACSDDFLEVENPTGDPLEEYYTTDEHIQEALVAAYAPLHTYDWDNDWNQHNAQYSPMNMMGELTGDDFWVGGADFNDNAQWHRVYNFSADADHTLSSMWHVSYWGVKRCNDVIFYLDNYVPEGAISSGNEQLYRMQARLLRAYYYNIIWHYFGNIPYYTENPQTPPYTVEQISADQVYENVIAELDAVIASDVLPLRYYKNAAGQDDETQLGRVTLAMAYMVYAEMVLYQNDTARFQKALDYMREIINKGGFSLVPDFASIWETSGEWGSESIWEINYASAQHDRCWDFAIATGGTILPCLISPNSYGGDDVWSGGKDGWGFFPVRQEAYDMYEPSDARRDATIWQATAGYTKRMCDTGLWLNKYRPKDANMPTDFDVLMNYDNNLRIYRYAETLLNAAELSVRLTGNSQGEAKTWLNMVQDRAHASYTPATIDNILTERHLEFVGEGKRGFDLIRAEGIAEATARNKVSGLATDDLYRTNKWTPNKKYLPISSSEIGADANLQQNPY